MRILALSVLTLLGSAGCAELAGFKTYSLQGSGGTPMEQQETGPITVPCAEVGSAPGNGGPPMASMQARDGGCFWIDTHEVTVAEYAVFLRNASPWSQSTHCEWNVPQSEAGTTGDYRNGDGRGFMPPDACVSQADIHLDDAGSEAANRPMTCVDWCDAFAFCRWAGKELCDDNGETGISTKSEWVDACAGNDASRPRLYGIRDEWSKGICNDGSVYPSKLQPVEAFGNCFVPSASGEDKVFDLTGNAAEWVGSCPINTEDGSCAYRGGDYESGADACKCAALAATSRKRTLPKLGFRCCAKPGASGD